MEASIDRLPVDSLKEVFCYFPVDYLPIITRVSKQWRTLIIDPIVIQSMVSVTERSLNAFLHAEFMSRADVSSRGAFLRSVHSPRMLGSHFPRIKKNIKIYCKSISYNEDDTIIFKSLLKLPNFIEESLLDGCELLCLLDFKAIRCLRHLFSLFPRRLSVEDRTDPTFRLVRKIVIFLLTNTSLYHASTVKVAAGHSPGHDDGKISCETPIVRYHKADYHENDSPFRILSDFLNLHVNLTTEVGSSLLMMNCGEEHRESTFRTLLSIVEEGYEEEIRRNMLTLDEQRKQNAEALRLKKLAREEKEY